MTGTERDNPGLILAPPLYPAIALVLAVALEFAVPLSFLPQPGPAAWSVWAGLALAVPGAIVVFRAIGLFNTANTAVSPHQPTSTIVTTGLYAVSRNPIYLGCLVFHAGINLIFSLEWGLILLPLVWLAFDRLVVVPEEAYLTRKFGDDYRAYLLTTRRWL